jgi:hypothetical protein
VRELGLAIVLWGLLGETSSVHANARDASTAPSVAGASASPASRITLRPVPGLEALAAKIARVLALRGNITVDLGPAPPPGLLEAVPAGNVALARADDASVHLVLGGARGASFDARVALSPNGEEDVRALALALEALRDRALQAENADRIAPAVVPSLREAALVDPIDPTEAANGHDDAQPTAAGMLPPNSDGEPRDDGSVNATPDPGERPLHVNFTYYFSVYGGASSQSDALRTGIGAGGGVCVQGHCLALAIEYPIPLGLGAGGDDVRYRYPTFSCSFYSRPWHFGRFTPGAGVALLTRVGYFDHDMGLRDTRGGLDTDLGVRGTLEGAYAILESVDIVAEAGLDYALDRWEAGHGTSFAQRGPRASPWLQAGIRIRPH